MFPTISHTPEWELTILKKKNNPQVNNTDVLLQFLIQVFLTLWVRMSAKVDIMGRVLKATKVDVQRSSAPRR